MEGSAVVGGLLQLQKLIEQSKLANTSKRAVLEAFLMGKMIDQADLTQLLSKMNDTAERITVDFFLNFLIAFISSGSAAPDLSYSHLINHFLIPEITQSDRLTDTQLQVCDVFAALVKIHPDRYKDPVLNMCLKVIGVDTTIESEFMVTPKSLSLPAILKILKILNESHTQLPAELFNQILDQLKYGNANADDILDVLRSFFKNNSFETNRFAWTDLILAKIFQSEEIAASIPFQINALFMFFPYILLKIKDMSNNQLWSVIKGGCLNTLAIVRKQSVFMLKEIINQKKVTNWPQLLPWNDNEWIIFFLIWDTLEEYSAHLLPPVLAEMPKLLAKFEEKDLNSAKDIRFWLFIILQRGFTHQNFSVRIQIMSTFLELFPVHKNVFDDKGLIFDGFFLAFDRLLNEERDIQFKKRDDDENEENSDAPQKEMKVKEKVVGFIKFILQEFISQGKYDSLVQYLSAKSTILANFILQIQIENDISSSIGDLELSKLSTLLQLSSAQSSASANLKQSIFKLLTKSDLSKISFNSLTKFLGGFSKPLGKEFDHQLLGDFFSSIKKYFNDEWLVAGLNSILSKEPQAESFSRAFLCLSADHQAVLLKNLVIIIQNNEHDQISILSAVIAELLALNSTHVLMQSNGLFEGLLKFLAQQLTEILGSNWNYIENASHLLVKIVQNIKPQFDAKEIIQFCSSRILAADFSALASCSADLTISTLKDLIIVIQVLSSIIVGYSSSINFDVIEKLLAFPKMQIATADFTLILAKFTKQIWKLTLNAIRAKSFSETESTKLFEKAVIGLEINSYQSLYYVYQSLYELSFGSPTNFNGSANFEEMMQSTWASFYDCKRKSHKITMAFLRLCFNHVTFHSEDTSNIVHELLGKVLKLSEHSPRLSHLLVAHLCALFESEISIATTHMSSVIELCLLPTDASVENPEEDLKLSSAALLFNVFLSGLAPESDPHVKTFIDSLIMNLINLNFESEFSKKEYSTHSKTNKRKLALWRTLAILTKFIDDKLMKQIDAKIWKILAMKNFGNIRYYIQLFIINALHRQPSFITSSLIPQLRNFNQDYTVATSMAVIATYLCLIALDRIKGQGQNISEEDRTLLVNLLQSIFPWTNHFNHGVRVTGQVAVHKVIQELKKDMTVYNKIFSTESSVLNNREFIDSLFNFMDQNKALIKLRKSQTKIIDGFNPINAASIDGMFMNNENLDSEIEMLLEETVKKAVKQFQHLVSANEDKISSKNSTDNNNIDKNADDQQKETIFQKRIIPWEQAVMELDKENKNPYALKKSRRSIIIVGTFLDNTPNVAGLARTAEIFNAKKLIIGNKKLLSEPIFQRISVSAEKHLPISEVTDRYLPEYLAAKKQKGYKIIGVEQTANSVSLKDYKFPEKCVLILGTEQEGIPPQFLQLVDVCVEIPQFGTIRSLNAHPLVVHGNSQIIKAIARNDPFKVVDSWKSVLLEKHIYDLKVDLKMLCNAMVASPHIKSLLFNTSTFDMSEKEAAQLLGSLVATHPSLDSFVLGRALESDVEHLFDGVRQSTTLKKLDITRVFFSEISAYHFREALCYSTALQELNISGVGFKSYNAHVHVMEGIKLSTSLKTLEISTVFDTESNVVERKSEDEAGENSAGDRRAIGDNNGEKSVQEDDRHEIGYKNGANLLSESNDVDRDSGDEDDREIALDVSTSLAEKRKRDELDDSDQPALKKRKLEEDTDSDIGYTNPSSVEDNDTRNVASQNSQNNESDSDEEIELSNSSRSDVSQNGESDKEEVLSSSEKKVRPATLFYDAISENKSITTIKVYKENLPTNIFGDILKNNQTLTSLEFDCCYTNNIEEFVRGIADALRVNSTLQSLEFGDFDEVADTWNRLQLFDVFEVNTSLRKLSFAGEDLSEETSGNLLAALKNNQSIQTLVVSADSMSPDRAKQFKDFVGVNTTLTDLTISGIDGVDDEGLLIFEALSANTTLKSLDVSGFPLHKLDACQLLGTILQTNTRTQHLRISGCGIEDDGAYWIAEGLKQNRGLTSLNIESNDTRQLGTKYLCESLHHHPTLTKLVCTTTKSDEEGHLGRLLTVNTTLQHLHLEFGKRTIPSTTHLCQGLKLNSTLQTLYTSQTCKALEDTWPCMKLLRDALMVNESVTEYEDFLVDTSELEPCITKNVKLRASRINSVLILSHNIVRAHKRGSITLPLEIWKLICSLLTFPGIRFSFADMFQSVANKYK